MAGPDEVAVEVVARIAWATDIGAVGVVAAMLALAGGGHVSLLDQDSVAVPVLQLVRGLTLWCVQMAVSSGQVFVENASITPEEPACESFVAGLRRLQYIPVLEGLFNLMSLVDTGILTPIGVTRIDGRAELSWRVEDLLTVLDREAADVGKQLIEMHLVSLKGAGEVLDHLQELLVGEGCEVDDCTFGLGRYQYGRVKGLRQE